MLTKLSMLPLDVTLRSAKRAKPGKPSILPAHSSPTNTDLRITHSTTFAPTKTRADIMGTKWPWRNMLPGDAMVLVAPDVIGRHVLNVARAHQRRDGSVKIKAKCIDKTIRNMRTYVLWCEETGLRVDWENGVSIRDVPT